MAIYFRRDTCGPPYKTNIKHFFRIDIQLYQHSWKGRRVSTQFLVFPISTRVDITVYQHGKCFIFVKYKSTIIKYDCTVLIVKQHLDYNII